MNDPRKKSNPTTRVAVVIVVAMLIVIGTLVYNAIKGKREYDEQAGAINPSRSAAAVAASAASH
ncbi:hypothetical protein LJR230_002593 [Trinickia sp. LjRoot230]|uniref:hypothetical protein n=1 Tax=Trinickia sp. LjRoot230 TaxID=3342288 RepID=UPI003ECCB9EF